MIIMRDTSLFIGVESQHWTIQDFQIAARNAKALGISSLIVKVADGTNIWYSNLDNIIKTIEDEGLSFIPYAYSYGNIFSALQLEINIIKSIISRIGMVIADMEVEWNGQTQWAQTLAQALKDKSGTFCITTWADPEMQNWQGVMQALKPVVDVWLPQVYTDFLASVYQQQFAGLNVVPVLNLDESFGPNNVIQHAKDAKTENLALWEYQAATGGYEQTVKEIVAMNKIPSGWSDDGQILRGPDGTPVRLGFRNFVLGGNWNPNDVPLREEYAANPVERSFPDSGPGTAQEFRFSRLCWTKAKGIYRSSIGKELIWYQDNK